ncbi:hypothetical protein V5799_028894 [Amblyomma americanum]|uniref:Uncharacterized protein n=1 Tax=Amblyomma americanum TaxID=6943 RepID=A0AAQ4DBJ9_AMBAM
MPGGCLSVYYSLSDRFETRNPRSEVWLIGDPTNAAIGSPAVLVATMADVSTLVGYLFNIVLLCDVPAGVDGVDCDELLRNANRKIAVATEPDWMSWK